MVQFFFILKITFLSLASPILEKFEIGIVLRDYDLVSVPYIFQRRYERHRKTCPAGKQPPLAASS